jgi:hypothetical protein
MRALLLLPNYLHWHYSRGYASGVKIFSNIIWFLWHFFSIGLLLGTLFAPWQKIHEDRLPGLNLENFFSNLIVNSLMRIAGAIIRLGVIAAGLVFVAGTFLLGLVAFIFWTVFPIAIVVFMIAGVVLLIK